MLALQHIRKYLDEILSLVYEHWLQLMLPLSSRAGYTGTLTGDKTGNPSPVSNEKPLPFSVLHDLEICLLYLVSSLNCIDTDS